MVEATDGPGRLRLVGGVVVLVLLLATCGSDGGDGDGSEPAPADQSEAAADEQTGEVAATGGCALISIEEVATITGEAIVDTTELPSGCQWTVTTQEGWYDWQSFPAELYQQNRDLAAEGGFAVDSAEGLGDEAFLRLQVDADGAVVSGETWVLLGDTAFQVRTASLGWSDDIEAAQRELAELIQQRL